MTYKERVQNLKKHLDRMILELPEPSHFELSQNAFYTTFLFVSMLVTGLLFAASMSVEELSKPEPQVSVEEMRLEHDVRKMVAGYPIERMMPYIVKQDKTTAAFLVGIAKKESNWGKRIPTQNGRDCYNYWGYRGAGSRGKAMGHGCFGSEQEAIETVSKRLDTLIGDYRFDTPEELVVWKCGWTCSGHSAKSVDKWIADVGYYANQIKN
ncbi:MAG: hypothetical protein A2808_04020 [Candidatus Moranbacteria bacterium RIFCSPHIGHO2_01_FULL_55_24]|nr:MAG: hypothetical protein A2808_04020 [Candidatus Moranbacteria bacterium RIFCSPHIGHO2_01_FULL_55_24]